MDNIEDDELNSLSVYPDEDNPRVLRVHVSDAGGSAGMKLNREQAVEVIRELTAFYLTDVMLYGDELGEPRGILDVSLPHRLDPLGFHTTLADRPTPDYSIRYVKEDILPKQKPIITEEEVARLQRGLPQRCSHPPLWVIRSALRGLDVCTMCGKEV